MGVFRGYRLADLEINYDLKEAIEALIGAIVVYLDTETMGFNGICFLIQFATANNPKKVYIIKILNESPNEIVCLLNELVKKKLIIHNAQFDIFHLSKLYTISKLCKDYSFESIWAAESIFRRNGSSYELRMELAHCFYPKKVIDTLLIAQHTFTLGDEFLKGNGYAIYRFPYSLLNKLNTPLLSESVWEKMLMSQLQDQKLVDYLCSIIKLNVNTKNTNTKKAQKELKDYPEKFAVTAKISYKAKGTFTAKNLARYYDYIESDKITNFEFLDSFTSMKKINKLEKIYKTPTIEDRELYQILYNHCYKQYENPRFINYSIRDIALIQVIHKSQIPESEYSEALITDLALVPYFANFKVYGVHVDKVVARHALEKVNRKMGETMAKLSLLPIPLDKPTSSQQVKEWLKKTIASSVDESEVDKLVPDTKKETISDLSKRFPEVEGINLLSEFKTLKNLSQHIPKNRDTIYPTPFIYSTVTNRMTFTKPNAQGIPPLARHCFTAPKGYSLCIGDFSQLEVRLAAYLFQVRNLIKAFREKEDPHVQTISAMSDGELEKFAKERGVDLKGVRQIGKRLGFSVIYGTSSKSLANELNCTIDEAEVYIEDYFIVNPELKKAIEDSNEKTTRIVTSKRYGKYRPYYISNFDKRPIPTITNMFGTRRNFTMSRCVARLLYYLANDKEYSKKNLNHLPKKFKDRFIKSIKSAYWSIQGRIKREAFNFVIQSTGSYLTKKLQREICTEFIPLGQIHQVSSLVLIPSLNVHDELHFCAKDAKTKVALDETKDRILAELSEVVGGPLELSFDTVANWAEKK